MKRNGCVCACRSRIIMTAAIATTLANCAYRLPPATLPSQHRLKIVARSPERYSVRVRDKEYSVGADGKVLIEFPATRRACSVYLFDRIPISRGPDPLKAKSISVLIAGNAVRTLSM